MNEHFDVKKPVILEENANIEYSNAANAVIESANIVDESGVHRSDIANAVAQDETEGETAKPILVQPIAATPRTENEKLDDAERTMQQMSRRSFLWGALAVGATYGGVNWINTRRKVDGLPWPLRQSHELNTQISQEFFSSNRLAPTFAKSQISAPRINGDIGLEGFLLEAEKWRLKVKGLASGETLSLSLADIKKLPRVEMTTEMKCIEGWSVVVTWAGARFSDFAAKYAPQTQSGEAPNVLKKPLDLLPFIGMSTPDGAYYIGLDMPSALHPQTLLCYEMNGQPLTIEHGAPLRLVTPVKYGIKHIKRIGTIEYSMSRPADYWAERGYDWGSGH